MVNGWNEDDATNVKIHPRLKILLKTCFFRFFLEKFFLSNRISPRRITNRLQAREPRPHNWEFDGPRWLRGQLLRLPRGFLKTSRLTSSNFVCNKTKLMVKGRTSQLPPIDTVESRDRSFRSPSKGRDDDRLESPRQTNGAIRSCT